MELYAQVTLYDEHLKGTSEQFPDSHLDGLENMPKSIRLNMIEIDMEDLNKELIE